MALRQAIQNLIDAKKISDPSPNVARNPLQNHQIHAIEEDLYLPDPVFLIRPISEGRREKIRELESRELSCVVSKKICSKKIEEEDETLLGLDIHETSSKSNNVAVVHNPTIMRWMEKMKFVPGFGLGKKQQGITDIIQPKRNPRRQGLGYNQAQRRNQTRKLNVQVGMITFDWNKVIETKEKTHVISSPKMDHVAT